MDKITCLNPNTGSSLKIDAGTYNVIHDAITSSLSTGHAITYTELVDRIRQYLKKKKIQFAGSISWYTVIVKHDMQSRGQLEVFTKQGKKLHKLAENT
ncbi:MAG TPA: hypothetical protein VLA58_03575 [Chitinophagaceae bacterium]|nr:hypothetical protein [Chitinophagaceae bacterium]